MFNLFEYCLRAHQNRPNQQNALEIPAENRLAAQLQPIAAENRLAAQLQPIAAPTRQLRRINHVTDMRAATYENTPQRSASIRVPCRLQSTENIQFDTYDTSHEYELKTLVMFQRIVNHRAQLSWQNANTLSNRHVTFRGIHDRDLSNVLQPASSVNSDDDSAVDDYIDEEPTLIFQMSL